MSYTDPSGSPEAAESSGILAMGVGAASFLIALGSTGMILLNSGNYGAAMGATRSARLKWELQQQQLEEEIAAEDLQQSPQVQTGEGDD